MGVEEGYKVYINQNLYFTYGAQKRTTHVGLLYQLHTRLLGK